MKKKKRRLVICCYSINWKLCNQMHRHGTDTTSQPMFRFSWFASCTKIDSAFSTYFSCCFV